MIRKPVKDGLGKTVRGFMVNPVKNILEHEDDLVHVSSYDTKPKEPKLGSREHKLKFPGRYASTYTSSLEQAAFPEPGTAPSEVAAAKKIVNENGPVKYDKNGLPNKATPEQVGRAAENLERMRQMNGKPDKPKNKKINPYSKVKIPIPTIINHSLLRKSVADKNKAAALEKLRVFAFTPRPNDVVKGIGSLMKTIAVKPEEEI